MSNRRLYMDVHVIQSVPPSCINRDDTGSPKTAQYGGVRRARVSSQAWKRAIRSYFQDSVRTKNIVSYVAKKVGRLAPDIDEDTAFKKAEEVLEKAGVPIKNHKTDAPFMIGNRQAEMLAKEVVDGTYTKRKEKDLKEILEKNLGIDIALFGRMVAGKSELNTDATCQVAHAISTHAVQTEFDYFTALDDFPLEDQSGADMLGNVEYNSSTLYRYANISVHEFKKLLENDISTTVEACQLFIEAFSNSMPTGKVNTFANQTLPNFVMVTLREDRPVNLVSAFEKPVQVKTGSGYVDESIEKLIAEYNNAGKFVDESLANFYLNVTEQSIEGVGETCNNLKELIQKAGQKIEGCLKEVGDSI